MRGLVVFPGNILQFEVGRTKSIAAVDHAMDNGKTLFLVAQKRVEVDEPGKDDLYDMGVVAEVKKVLHISDEEKRYIENAEVGSGLLIADKVVVPFNNTFPQDTELFRLMDTNPNRKK